MFFNQRKSKNICQDIIRNEATVLVLGFQSSKQRKRDSFTNCKREIKAICSALSQNASITSVSLGPRLKSRSLRYLIPAISKLPNLKSLHLNVSAVVIPEDVVSTLKQCQGLEKLDIVESWVQTNEYEAESHFNFASLLPHLPNLKSFSMKGCGLYDEYVYDVCRFVSMMRPSSCLDELCLADNWRISHLGLDMLGRLDNVRRLDLSGCDIRGDELKTLANSISSGSSGSSHSGHLLHELDLSNNDLMLEDYDEQDGFMPFLETCSRELTHLDVSNCGVSKSHLLSMISELQRQQEQDESSSTLEFVEKTIKKDQRQQLHDIGHPFTTTQVQGSNIAEAATSSTNTTSGKKVRESLPRKNKNGRRQPHYLESNNSQNENTTRPYDVAANE